MKIKFCWLVWNFGFVVDFEYPYVGIGLGPVVIRIGMDRPNSVPRGQGE